MEMQEIRDRLAAAVGGEQRLAEGLSARTMRDLKQRAARELDDGAATVIDALERIAAAIAREQLEQFAPDPEEFIAGYVKRFAAYQAAGARTMNWMVTGPARFPVERNRKAMDSEHKRLGEMLDYAKTAPYNAVKRAKAAKARALGAGGMANAELEDLKTRLEKRELAQRQMKAVNEIIRRHKLGRGDGETLAALATDRGFPMNANRAGMLLTPDWGKAGYQSYQLQNNLAEIKRLQQRVAQVERKAAAIEAAPDEPAEREVNGIRIVEDVGDDRLRLIFDGKPAPEMIDALKRRGFKWSPRNMAWQRQLTANAREAAEQILKVAA